MTGVVVLDDFFFLCGVGIKTIMYLRGAPWADSV
jgi:hypothetical protein